MSDPKTPVIPCKAHPGIILVLPLEEKEPINLGEETSKYRVMKGKILAVGDPEPTIMGKTLATPVKPGMTVWFLSYEGNYDNTKIDGEQYYFVKFADIRGYK